MNIFMIWLFFLCGENLGFYFVRSNERTIKTWEHSFDAMEKNGKLDDQAIFWTVLRQATDPTVHFFRNCSDLSPNDFSINNKLTICPLNLCMFNSGGHDNCPISIKIFDSCLYKCVCMLSYRNASRVLGRHLLRPCAQPCAS